MTATTAISCPTTTQRARPRGFERAVMLVGLALTRWGRERAESKLARQARHPLASLSDGERAAVYRESSELRDAAYAQRAQWHLLG